jgi:4'-phosphopantetheinyl transferase
VTGSSAKVFSVSDSSPGSLGEGLLSLGVQDVHLWLCSRDRVTDSDEFKRLVLSRYASVVPSDWQFALNGQGKPSLVGSAYALDFNLSHTGDWLVCAVTAGTPVGVDLEFCNPNREVMKLARRFFRLEEVAALQVSSEAQHNDRFYDFWTLKEAAVKARGEALVPGLESRGFVLTFQAGSVLEKGRIVVTTPDDADTAQYCLLDPLPKYRLAICWLAGAPLGPPQLKLFELREGGEVAERIVPLRASTWLV